MKFLVSTSALLKHLQSLHGIISTNPVVPILENFLFDVRPGKLTVTASDLETSVVAELVVETQQSGRVALPARLLLETLKNLPDQPVTFTLDMEAFTAEISSLNGRYKLSGENAADFPRVPVVKGRGQLEIPSPALARAISKTVFAVSTDELRPAMTGILMQLTEDHLTFVATDGHRLLRYRRPAVGPGGPTASLIIPRKAFALLRSSLPNEATPVQVEYNQNNAFFSFNQVRMVCRLIDERYPDYENVLPVTSPNKLTINRQQLLNSVKRLSIYANRTTHQVRLSLSGAELVISAENLDSSSEARETLTCQYQGEPLQIGFNGRLLQELLSNLDGEEVTLALSTPHRAGLLTPAVEDANEEVLMLLMPVMLSQYA